MTTKIWKFNVDPCNRGLRLDQLISIYTGLSRRRARFVIKIGGVQIARKRIKVAGKIINCDAEISVAYDYDLKPPVDIKLTVLFEDEWLLIVDKPADIPSQGTQYSDQHDLMAMLHRQRPDQTLLLQHRLDQGTSGVLIISKHPSVNIGNQFQDRTITKIYLARVSNPIDDCSIDLPIGQIRNVSLKKYGCLGDLINVKPSRTDFNLVRKEDLDELQDGFWIMAKPYTGRTHQIRVHLAYLGNPVLGDKFYGGAQSDQLWLHAWKLILKHPITNEVLTIVAPPKRFLKI